MRAADPVGLGFRVPLVVASPWSRGGFVCSQVFDHTSVLQLLEKILSHRSGKEIRETNISAWRRTVCGDLSTVFGLRKRTLRDPCVPLERFLPGRRPPGAVPAHAVRVQKTLGGRDRTIRAESCRGALDAPAGAGIRPSSALPYELYAEGANPAGRKAFRNHSGGPQGSLWRSVRRRPVSRVCARQVPRSPRTAYPGLRASPPAKRLTDAWEIAGFEGGKYHLRVSGPNGFFREFAGTESDPPIDIRCQDLRTGDVELHISSRMQVPCNLNVTDLAYKSGNHQLLLAQVPAARSYCLLAAAINGTTST
jgi:phospholipase C